MNMQEVQSLAPPPVDYKRMIIERTIKIVR